MSIHSEKETPEETTSQASEPTAPVPSFPPLAGTIPAIRQNTPEFPASSPPAGLSNILASQEKTDSDPLSVAASPPETKPLLLIDAEGQFLPEWWEQHDSLKELGKTLKKFKSPEALARSYAELEKLRTYPDPGDEERMRHIRHFLGVPEKKEDYKLTPPDLAKGHESCWDSDLASHIAETAYEYAIPPKAMQALAETFTKEQEQYLDRQQEEIEKRSQDLQEKTLGELKNLWGPHCQTKIERAAHTLGRLCQECGLDSAEFGNNPSLGSNPHLIRLLDHVNFLLGEPELKGHRNADCSTAAEDVKRMEKDPSHPLHEAYMNYSHPNHEYANRLYDKVMFSGDH